MKPRRALTALLAVPILLIAACAGSGVASTPSSSGAGGGTTVATTLAAGAPAVPADGRAGVGVPSGFGTVAQAVQAPQPVKPGQDQITPLTIPVPQAFDGSRALILTANVALRADDPWAIADRVQAVAAGLGGDVLSLNQSGAKDQKSASLTMRVPQASFNDALRQIRAIGDVEVVSSAVSGQDVTDQFVDLQARLKAKQDEEQRYLALLARADKVEDVLRIDNVLAQVRTQIEQLSGQVNSMKARTTYSTITVQISPNVPALVPTPGPLAYDPSKTMERAVTALATTMRGVLDAAIWALVFSWIPLILFGLVLLVGRTRGRIASSA